MNSGAGDGRPVSGRLERRFAALADQGRAGLVTFITAGDPNLQACTDILLGLPGAGADVIELGMPFSDPMAEGPSIQASSLRALSAGQTMAKTLGLVRALRARDADTPVVLMGYYNPIYRYGAERFAVDAAEAGVDGLIIVDLPPEEDAELRLPAAAAGIRFVRLTTPTTDDKRAPTVLGDAGGFVYYVSVTGVTGGRSAQTSSVEENVARLRRHTDLPIAVGFGIKTPQQAAEIAGVADAAVVGSAIVDRIAAQLDEGGNFAQTGAKAVLGFVRELADGVSGVKAA